MSGKPGLFVDPATRKATVAGSVGAAVTVANVPSVPPSLVGLTGTVAPLQGHPVAPSILMNGSDPNVVFVGRSSWTLPVLMDGDHTVRYFAPDELELA